MLDDRQYERILHSLPFLRRAEPQARREFLALAYLARIPAGRDVFVEGDHAEAIALLLSGVVRVYKIGENGREITLYRFGHGESCVLTANVILSRQTFPAIATVEQEAEAVMIPAAAFRDWIGRYDLWRDFTFGLLSQRLASLMATVDEVVFRRLDKRLAERLLEQSRGERQLITTHQQLAAELGSSREVISRLLEQLESEGLIRRLRGAIEVVDRDGLEVRAGT
jgi:CRP/FNR family transcriptional regulator